MTLKTLVLLLLLVPLSASAANHIASLPLTPMHLKDIIVAACNNELVMSDPALHLFIRPYVMEREKCPKKQ